MASKKYLLEKSQLISSILGYNILTKSDVLTLELTNIIHVGDIIFSLIILI
jgi:hypothetical protein